MDGTIGVLSLIGLILWILVSVSLLGALVYAYPLVRRWRRVVRRLDRILEKSEPRMDPLLRHLERSADNADYITTAIRSDVEAIGDTVDRAARSTRRMFEMAEDRAAEINGLLQVAQEEAEDTFLSTASALRAIRGASRRSERRDSGRRSA